MNQELLTKIDNWFEAHKRELIADLKRIVRIPSISDAWKEGSGVSLEEHGGPFGRECKKALDEMLLIGREHGFDTENYEDYVGSIGVKGSDMSNTIGFWNHLDVVPVGTGWSQDPFELVEKEGFLIARGVGDNKSPAIGMLYLMKCIKELGIETKHNLRLFVGCNEESGMEDMAYYTAHYPCPKLSLIPDCGFPACYGEKGIIEGQFVLNDALSDEILSVTGGNASNIIPDYAEINLVKKNGLLDCIIAEKAKKQAELITVEELEDSIKIGASGTSCHSAFPEGSRNAIHELAAFLMAAEFICEEDRKQFSFIEKGTREYYGEVEGINFEDEISGKTTCAGTVLKMEGRVMTLTLNIRYSIKADSKKMIEGLSTFAETYGAYWRLGRDSKPGYIPKDHPAVVFLTDMFSEWIGEKKEAYVMGGGTYARMLPNAFAYGLSGMVETEEEKARKKQLFKPGTGGAHEPDEALHIRTYFEALKFYTLAVIELDQVI